MILAVALSGTALHQPKRHHSGAYVFADVTIDPWEAGGSMSRSVDAYFTGSDCSRTTTLDFRAEDRAEFANAMYKARSLQRVLDEFVVALEAAGADLDLT